MKACIFLMALMLTSSGLSGQIAHVVTPNTSDSWEFHELGNDLLSECEAEPGSTELAFCMAYVAGAIDMIGALQGSVSSKDNQSFWKLASVCLPKEATLQQVIDVVVKEMKENPERRADEASWIVIRALVKAWGCPAK